MFSIAFNSNCTEFVSNSYDTVRLWDANTYDLLAVMPMPADSHYAISYSSDAKKIAMIIDNYHVCIYDIQKQKMIESLQLNDFVTSIAFSPDNTSIVIIVKTRLLIYTIPRDIPSGSLTKSASYD